MSLKTQLLLLAAAISLAACGENPTITAASTPAAASAPTNAPAAASETTAAASAPEAAAITLASKDNKVQFTLQNTNGLFQDKLGEANLLPEGVPAEQVTLLQRNDDADLTLSVVQAGKTDKAADKLFAELKKEIEGDQSVKDVQVDDSVAYRYTQANEDSATNESCIAHLSADKELAVVCATSGQMSANELKDLLANGVKFN